MASLMPIRFIHGLGLHASEVADLVVLPASERGGNVTGADVLIDGGLVKTL